MKLSGVMLLMIFYCELFVYRITAQASGRPSVVNIGALLSFNTNVGKVAKLAIKAAVDDVNSDPTTLGGTKLKLQMQDCNHNGFLALAEGKSFVILVFSLFANIMPASELLRLLISYGSSLFNFAALNSLTLDGRANSGHNRPPGCCDIPCSVSCCK